MNNFMFYFRNTDKNFKKHIESKYIILKVKLFKGVLMSLMLFK